MFDRLIESDTAGAEFKPRSRYFFVSSVVVGLLFVSAVIISIYAAEVGLGNDSFILSAILPPVGAPQIVPDAPRSQTRHANPDPQVPQRPTNTQRPEESPSDIPPVSVSPNYIATRPSFPFQIGEFREGQPPPADYGNDRPEGSGTSDPLPRPEQQATDGSDVRSDAPPPKIVKPGPPRTIGVVNGIATNLPKPPYPPVAIAAGIQGKVDVQVTIDEEGNVISARAASGNVLLRDAAVRAAWKARFTPTKLSNVPVKVTGVIVYNFTR